MSGLLFIYVGRLMDLESKLAESKQRVKTLEADLDESKRFQCEYRNQWCDALARETELGVWIDTLENALKIVLGHLSNWDSIHTYSKNRYAILASKVEQALASKQTPCLHYRKDGTLASQSNHCWLDTCEKCGADVEGMAAKEPKV